jgi:site-specific DNA-methyltransferase (adenine-specific)
MIMIKPDWERSNIKLWKNDCFNILPQIKSKSIDLILADLPYGITACEWDKALPMDKLWEQYLRVAKDNTAIILTAVQPFAWMLCASMPDLFRYDIIWEKPNGTNPLLVKKQPFRCHEHILVFYKKQPTYNPQMAFGYKTYSGFSDSSKKIGEAYSGKEENLPSKHKNNTDGSRYPRSVQLFAQDRSGHPTKKPVELFRWLVKTYSNEGDKVLDNTMGEGTTGVACAIENRGFYGIEINQDFFATAQQTIERALNTNGKLDI